MSLGIEDQQEGKNRNNNNNNKNNNNNNNKTPPKTCESYEVEKGGKKDEGRACGSSSRDS